MTVTRIATTVVQVLEEHAIARPRAWAIVSPETNSTVTYQDLVHAVHGVSWSLRSLGIREGDRVGILMPNSPVFAIAFFAILGMGGIAVPINPLLKQTEVAGILNHAGAEAVLVDDVANQVPGATKRVSLSANTHRITCLFLPHISPTRDDPAVERGDALLMYTSGTTGHPKGVILQNKGLLAAAQTIAAGYELRDTDRALCVLSLTHVHGLVGTMLSTLCSGGTLVLPSRFSASRFWGILAEYGITWFSAVPTIFAIALQQPLPLEAETLPLLRFARSASAPLPLRLLAEFERRVGCPVLEAYGLTEATHQAASNPLPPEMRKAGSVGVPTGPEVAVLSEDNHFLPAMEEGELVLRGGAVTRGYFKNQKANDEAFYSSWFRTGDLGYIDQDGYVFITGRKKEQINRGGHKISPREVDEILYKDPRVVEAATVGLPDHLFGEEVVSFVVLKPGEPACEEELKQHCARYLADYKCPKAIHFVADLPKSLSGKIQRRRLVEAHG